MKASIFGLCFLIVSVLQVSAARQEKVNPPTTSRTNAEQEIISPVIYPLP